jgi:hypothetical protein
LGYDVVVNVFYYNDSAYATPSFTSSRNERKSLRNGFTVPSWAPKEPIPTAPPFIPIYIPKATLSLRSEEKFGKIE